MKQGGHLGSGRLSQNSRWRRRPSWILGVRLTQKSFGVFHCVIHVEIWNLGLGIHSNQRKNCKTLYFHVNTPLWTISLTKVGNSGYQIAVTQIRLSYRLLSNCMKSNMIRNTFEAVGFKMNHTILCKCLPRGHTSTTYTKSICRLHISIYAYRHSSCSWRVLD